MVNLTCQLVSDTMLADRRLTAYRGETGT